MRIFRTLGGGTIVAVAAMAIWAQTAMAEGTTALCRAAEAPCSAGNRLAGVHTVATLVKLKVGAIVVLCLSSLAEGPVEGPALSEGEEYLHVKIELLPFEKCGTNAAHSNCELINTQLPLYDLLAVIAENAGVVAVLNWQVKVNCPGLITGCTYGEVEPYLVANPPTIGKGGYSAFEETMNKITGGLACPKTATWTSTYENVEAVWISS